MLRKLALATCLLLALAVLLTGCGMSPAPEEPLEDRVLARWNHMIERDFEAAWELYSPGFRAAMTQRDFARDMERRPVRWLAVEWVGAECEEDVCDVTVNVTTRAVGAPGVLATLQVPRDLNERWLRIDGQWW
ncbi:MAG: hypothetical protein ACXIUM_12595, partial [Wenzhouxiangella sp.]